MQFDQENPTHRAVVALLMAGLITFALWGVWMSLGFIIGVTGWLAQTIGTFFLSVSSRMTAAHVTVAWVGLACGVIFGSIIGFSIRVDRLWEKLGKGKKPIDGESTAS